MKRVDKLILSSFLGPFFLTFLVVIFILLSQFMLKYFDDFVGKGLGIDIYLRLFGYFSINMTPNAFPLAVLLSSLMTFGNLGEHSELTALKGAGVSLTRALQPIFIFSLFLSVVAFFSNNYIVPKANLKAYSLLYDIKQKTPALNNKEGAFFSDIPGYQIKVNKKYPDGRTLKDIIIYDHTQKSGNKEIYLADSGRMFNILNDQYLVLELFNGNHYLQQEVKGKRRRYKNHPEQYVRNNFKESKMVLSMASFEMKRTREELFSGSRYMKSVKELSDDVDSMECDIKFSTWEAFDNFTRKFRYHMRKDSLNIPEDLIPETYGRSQEDSQYNRDHKDEVAEYAVKDRPAGSKTTSFSSASGADQGNVGETAGEKKPPPNVKPRSVTWKKNRLKRTKPDTTTLLTLAKQKPEGPSQKEIGADSLIHGTYDMKRILKSTLTDVRFVKNDMMVRNNKVQTRKYQIYKFEFQRFTILAQAFACITMFLIGAPLGSIIKRGGLGFPVLFSILFFVIYYVFMMLGGKWAKQGLIYPVVGAWLPNLVLFPFGLFFLRQARIDARLFDVDFYNVAMSKVKQNITRYLKKNK